MKIIIGSIAAATLLLSGAASAQAADTIVASDTCCTFIDGPFTQAAGETITFDNPATADAIHNVTSTQDDPYGEVLFVSDSIPPGEPPTPVRGTQYLEEGTYPFYCTIHTTSMSGELTVSGGTPLPRPVPDPKLKLTLPNQKLKKVRGSGKFKVTLKNPGKVNVTGVAVSVSKGKKKLGSASGISVKRGASKTVSVKLTGKGKKTIKQGKKISFSVKATFKGGKPVTASRALR